MIVAGVIRHDHGRLMRELADEIAPPQLGRLKSELAGRNLDQALDHEGGLRASSTTVGIDRTRVGIDRIHFAMDVRNVVLARQQRAIKISRHRR